MIRAIANSFRLSRTIPYQGHRLHTTAQTDLQRKIRWNKDAEDQARSLIFGEVHYKDMTPKQRALVDLYQGKKLQEDAAILPNTGAALEQAEIEEILFSRTTEKD